ncbi:SgcJ/EcaC family oxidoreductase [Actinocrispum sp. NPDC049592]|uniref:SgcJ/EcaC family oxidoreductase n=1 Tax=Actinocrispum sp. NPDC049592 TaxID=3154835 RepID=UPI0034386B08
MIDTDRTAAITAVLDSLADAWARGDGDAYGAHFTEDATYITFVGTRYQGRDDIAGSHNTLFAKFLKDTKLAHEVLDVRFLGADAAVVTTRGDTYKGEHPKKLTKVQTYTFVRQDGHWLVAAFHNTQRKPLMEAISFRFAPETKPKAWPAQLLDSVS